MPGRGAGRRSTAGTRRAPHAAPTRAGQRTGRGRWRMNAPESTPETPTNSMAALLGGAFSLSVRCADLHQRIENLEGAITGLSALVDHIGGDDLALHGAAMYLCEKVQD